uniref:G-protein coupled receptors family 1 profile domain-containing protein n=1 Tax=Meloidogyne javanica TaxID=6303 RepID=A0A915LUW7_MELJA
MTETFLFVYASAELILAAQIAISNFLVIFVYLRSKHIRTPTNAYIFSLALTDFLTGALGIPFTVASVLTRWPGSFYPCLAIHLILCVLCTVSTLHLLAMAVDKYLTICLRRFVEQRNSSSTSVRKTRAHFLIVGCWLIGTAIAGLPMVDGFGIRSEERQIKCLLRASERQRRISVRRKLIRILLILVLTYAFCWYPLYLINTVDLFLPPTYHPGQMTTLFAVVLSHLNCALNPLIYAYGMPGFKHSLRRFLPAKVKNTCTQQPVSTNNINHVTHKNVIAQSFAVIPPMNSPFGGGYGQPMGTKRIATTSNNNFLNNNTMENNNSFIGPKQSETKEDCEGKGELFLKEVVKNEPPQTPFPTLNKTSLSLLEMKRENFRLKSRIVFSSFDEQSPPLKHSSTFETEDNPSFNNSFEENNNNKKVSFVKFKLEKHDEYSPTCCDDEQTCLEEDKHNFKFELGKRSLSTSCDEEKHNFKLEHGKQSLPSCCDEEEHNFNDRKTSKMSTFSIRIFNGQWLVRKRGKKFSVREEANINENGK